jgi:hypothetical protein
LNGAALSCVLDRSMAEPVLLNAPRVVAGIRQRIAAGMAQHMRVHREGEAGAHTNALDKAVDSVRREWAAALRGEDEGRVRALIDDGIRRDRRGRGGHWARPAFEHCCSVATMVAAAAPIGRHGAMSGFRLGRSAAREKFCVAPLSL